jgi:hypothetical protein
MGESIQERGIEGARAKEERTKTQASELDEEDDGREDLGTEACSSVVGSETHQVPALWTFTL